jgi:hypothetical protein
MVADMAVTLYSGKEDLEVVGESYHQPTLWAIVGGETDDRVRHDCHAVLSADQDNEYDANAVSVWVMGSKVGHLSRSDAAALRSGLQKLHHESGKPVALAGVIAGGGIRRDGRGMLGVFLNYDPEDFGLASTAPDIYPSPVSQGAMRTGLSDAMASDAEDDSYDLSWLETIPDDAMAAVKRLYALLADDEDPIDRHYMMVELEGRLYRARDSFTSALDDYDSVCTQHDQEMGRIAEAFVAKWDQIPLLGTYKQQAIRQQKAGAYDEGLWWARRGVEIYGSKAARQEWVEDLEKRVRRFEAKLNPKQP